MWGTSFPAAKIGLNYLDAFLFVFLRFLFTSIVMLLLLLLIGKYDFQFKEKKLILFLGITSGVSFLLQYIGMSYTSAVKSSLFVGLSAIWVALLSPVLLKEPLGTKKIIGVLSGFFGVFLVTTNLDFSFLGQGELIGDLLVLSSGVILAFFILYNKELVSKSKNTLQLITLVMFGTLLTVTPFVFFSTSDVRVLPIEAWAAIGYLVVFCGVIPYYLWFKSLRHISTVTSTVVLLVEIIIAVAISSVVLNEMITLFTVAGTLLIVSAIVLVSWNSK